MTAKEFWDSFYSKVVCAGDEHGELCKAWKNTKNFTTEISRVISNVITSHYKSKDEEIRVQPEYLRIDIPAWQDRKDDAECFVSEASEFQKYAHLHQ